MAATRSGNRLLKEAEMKSLQELLLQHGSIMQGPKSSVKLYPEPEALSFILNYWTSGEATARGVHNPTTSAVIGSVHDCSPHQIDIAFSATRDAQRKWADIPVLQKRKVLDTFAHLLDEYRGELTLLIAQEMGKTATTADADIEESIHAAEHYRDIMHLAMSGEFRDAQLSDKKAFSKRFPYGTVLAIKPFNFIALYWWTVCAAITAGNSVVIKAAEEIPFTVNATVSLFHEALTSVLGDQAHKVVSLVQVLHGKGEIVGESAARNGDYDMMSFTGGTETAKKLRLICAERGKKFHMESGGHAAIIVLEDFDLEKAANEITLAAFGDAGQRCTSCKVVFAQNSISDKLLPLVIEKARKLRIGDPARLDTRIGPIIHEAAFDRILKQTASTISGIKGRLPILGGMAISNKVAAGVLDQAIRAGFNIGEELKAEPRPLGHFLVPTIFTDIPYGVCAMDEEIFGPVLVFNSVSGRNPKDVLERAVDFVNRSQYGLSSALLTNDVRLLFWAFDHTNTGVWYGGRGTTGAEVPGYFSVVKDSGDGWEAYGIEAYSWVKQGWLDLHPATRLAQTETQEKIAKRMSATKSLFS